MSQITIQVLGQARQLPAQATLQDALALYSPYGEEAVVCRLNGQVVRSIDNVADCLLQDEDELEIYPLIIGG